MISEPCIEDRSEQPYIGIRTQVPMKGMSTEVTKLMREVTAWMEQQAISPAGPPFLRFYVIDMTGDMDIEVGIPIAAALPGDGRISAGMIPAGRYASLRYSGSGLAGNKALIEWAEANGIKWDRWNDAKGDAFRARYESYLTDPKIEPDINKWVVELAIKLAEDQESGGRPV